jgi:streptogramin lyase
MASGGRLLTYCRPSVIRLFVLAFALVVGLAIALCAMLSAAQAAPLGSLKQFRVPTDNSQPRSITNGADGKLWFTEGNEVFTPGPDDPDAGGTTHRNIGKITPTGETTGEITEFRIESRDPDSPLPNQCDCLPNDIVQGPSDILYFTTNNPGLGRITTDGVVLDFVAPPNNNLANGDGIAAHEGDVWYADFNNDSLWRYDTTGTTGNFTQFHVPEPSDVAVDKAGIVWFTVPLERGIGRLDPATGNVTVTPTETLVPRGLTVAADGDIWFTARFTPQGVGRLVPVTGKVTEFPLTNVGPQDIAASPDGSVWFTQTTKGNIAQIREDDAGGITITEGKVVKNSEPFGITVAPNGDPWYTMLEANRIATLQLK